MSEILNKVTASVSSGQPWTGFQKYVFRTFFIFFAILLIPTNPNYYKKWVEVDWTNLHIRDIGNLSGSGFMPIKVATKREGGNDLGGFREERKYIATIYPESGEYGAWSYINWGIAFVLGAIGGAIWSVVDRRPRNYDILYYFLGAFVSFAMLIRLQGLTFSKVFPTQMPDLALTQLNTPLGDFVAQKLYWIQFSFVHNYERFAGYAELLIMFLLFFRQTRALGAALSLAMIGNIAFTNHAYDGGIHLAASFYVVGGLFVLWRYIPPLWKLLVKQEDTALNIVYYPYSKPWEKALRYSIKLFVFGLFFVYAGYAHWQNYLYDSYKVPALPGLANARGLYSVDSFNVNGNAIPYSPLDSVRWQEVTLEKWATLSFSVFNTFEIHGEAGRGKQFADVDRTYESAGTGGGRRHYHYVTDSVQKILHLQNKNKVYGEQKLDLQYERPTSEQLILLGKNEYQDSIYMVLNRKDKTYPLYQDRHQEIVWKP